MPQSGKKVLIIGNGFDLAHGLPTTYTNFMDFCKIAEAFVIKAKNPSDMKEWLSVIVPSSPLKDNVKDLLIEIFNKPDGDEKTKSSEMMNEIYGHIQGNIWYGYFLSIQKRIKGSNWIDFESEISEVIQFLDENINRLEDRYNRRMFPAGMGKIEAISGGLFYGAKDGTLTGIEIREKCFSHLERLVRALEIYLSVFVQKITCEKLDVVSQIQPDYVMSFNYTDTYERVYGVGTGRAKVLHIHGSCQENNTIDQNDMVLGIDEYWDDYNKDIHTNFSVFKKFVQRIRKKTGAGIYTILDGIEDAYKVNNYDSAIYVFGHSLDKTDKDVLSQFLGNKATVVKVYCKDRGSEGELIAKMIQLIGQENLLAKVYTEPSRLEFEIL